MSSAGAESLSARLVERVRAAIASGGGWLPFDRYMAIALYEPGLGYYARDSRQFGTMPSSGSDFVTAPELSPLFGRALARQVAQALQAAQADEVVEFGAGSGALAAQLLGALGGGLRRYSIVDLSGTLRQRQAETLAPWRGTVRWLDEWPAAIDGVVVGNEVLDAMPVQLLHFDGHAWRERGVVVAPADAADAPAALGAAAGAGAAAAATPLAWADRPTSLRPPRDPGYPPGSVTEVHLQAQAFVRTLADRLRRGAAFFVDYGFPEAEYYHPQRDGGTLLCHRGHRVDADPLADVGTKDITAHVDFSAIALAAQDAGLDVLGYTSQARFLLNCGVLDLLPPGDARAAAAVQKLLNEHEMGEFFKVIALGRGIDGGLLGFGAGDRTHTL